MLKNLIFQDFLAKKAQSDAVKWIYGTIKCKINKKMSILLKLAQIITL